MICFLPSTHFYLPNIANFLLLATYMTFFSKSFRMKNNSLCTYNPVHLKVIKHSYFLSILLHSSVKFSSEILKKNNINCAALKTSKQVKFRSLFVFTFGFKDWSIQMMAVPSLEQVTMLSCENLHIELKSVSVTTRSPSWEDFLRNTVIMRSLCHRYLKFNPLSVHSTKCH